MRLHTDTDAIHVALMFSLPFSDVEMSDFSSHSLSIVKTSALKSVTEIVSAPTAFGLMSMTLQSNSGSSSPFLMHSCLITRLSG